MTRSPPDAAATPTGTGGRRPERRAASAWFEIDRDRDDAPTEHDPVDYDTWDAGDLIDYLNAVGQPKLRPSTTRTTDPTT
ncbi:MAG: hypothetical protein KF699_08800 [Phycisphaeraceae bacterium]|nr:hypothetical protein [Phycisphaeraceae bacterium]